MNEETLAALRGSINKWERVLAGEQRDGGAEDCALCQVFKSGLRCCAGCPVEERTGQPNCRGTPYERWMSAQGGRPRRVADSDELRSLASDELEFLKSLLPTATTSTEVLPCPFCGGPAECVCVTPSGLWSVKCADVSNPGCPGLQTAYSTIAEATRAWNRRAPPPPQAVEEPRAPLINLTTEQLEMLLWLSETNTLIPYGCLNQPDLYELERLELVFVNSAGHAVLTSAGELFCSRSHGRR